MSLWRRRGITGPPAQDLIPSRRVNGRGGAINGDTAMRNSTVWGCLRLRANLQSMFDIKILRTIDNLQVSVATPNVFVSPGAGIDFGEYIFSTSMDLDRFGNTVGLITEKDAYGRPAQVELQSMVGSTARIKDGRILWWRIGGTKYQPEEVWQERQYTIPGLPIGLSPIAYAAWTLNEYRSIQEFATTWFDNGTIPSATLKNNQRTVSQKVSDEVKSRYRTSVQNGDLFVFGAEWEFNPIAAESAASGWIEAKHYDDVAICRFLDVPADEMDANIARGSSDIVYANIIQKNLQLLVKNLQPTLTRRERALSNWLSQPRYMRFDPDALLRMDPITRSQVIGTRITNRVLTPSEGRAMDNLPPLTTQQIEEFNALFGKPQSKPQAAQTGGPPA